MSDDKPAPNRAIYKTLIKAPIETVWNTLVKTDEVLPFFFGGVCDTADGLKPGAAMRMITPDRKFASVVGEVLDFSPPYRYAHTMRFTNLEDAPCTVIYELKQTPDGVEFSLITENVPIGSKSEKSMAQGGPFIINNLKALAETGKPALSGRMVVWMAPMMGLFTPKICKIENWPLEVTSDTITAMSKEV